MLVVTITNKNVTVRFFLMDMGFLEQSGLSKNEAKAYLALLRLGKANSAELARESGIHRINVYDVLNSLISKGMVSYFSEGRARVFKAESPEKLKVILSEKLGSLETILPELLAIFNSHKEPWEVTILRGVEGKKSQFEELLHVARDTQNFVFLPHGMISLERQPYKTTLYKWYKGLAERNVETKALILDTKEARQRVKSLKETKKYHARFSKEIKFAPVSWDVCADLLFLTFHIEPYLIIRIKSKEIAGAFKNNFEIMWKAAKK